MDFGNDITRKDDPFHFLESADYVKHKYPRDVVLLGYTCESNAFDSAVTFGSS